MKEISMTEGELFQEYLERGFDDIMDFPTYIEERLKVITLIEVKEGGE